jgi:hypothetical protein
MDNQEAKVDPQDDYDLSKPLTATIEYLLLERSGVEGGFRLIPEIERRSWRLASALLRALACGPSVRLWRWQCLLSPWNIIVSIILIITVKMPLTLNPYTGKPFSAAYQAIRSQAQALPVSEHMPRLLQAIRNHQVTVIVGETGSGKSTQTPQAILEALSSELGDKMVCLTQPRRLAAQSVSNTRACCNCTTF